MMRPVALHNHIVPLNGRPPRPPSRAERIPGEPTRQVIRDHFHYELRSCAAGTKVVARPLSRAAQDWLSQRRVEAVHVECPDDEAGACIRRLEAAVDVATSLNAW